MFWATPSRGSVAAGPLATHGAKPKHLHGAGTSPKRRTHSTALRSRDWRLGASCALTTRRRAVIIHASYDGAARLHTRRFGDSVCAMIGSSTAPACVMPRITVHSWRTPVPYSRLALPSVPHDDGNA